VSMTVSDTILGPGRGTAAGAIAAANGQGALRFGEVTAYLNEVFRLARLLAIDPSIAVSQSAHETDYWRSGWWTQRLNPAGIGITGDPAQNAQSHTWTNGTDAAQSHLAHLLVYVLGPSKASAAWAKAPGAAQPLWAVDPRYDAYVEAYGDRAIARTIHDLAGTWAVDPAYDAGIVAKSQQLFAHLPDQGAVPVADGYTTTVPGLPGGPLVTTYPIRLNLIPPGHTSQRPGIPARTPRRSVQHGTGNPSNADAMAEAQYFVNGAEGRQASVHYCTDDRQAVVVVPLHEVTWQAADGAGPGNMNGFSCEMMEADAIWQNVGRRDRLIAITADLMGRTAARLGATTPERHWDFNAGSPDRHHCPDKLMTTGLWDAAYVPQWQAARQDERRRMAGGELPGGKPVYATPHPPALQAGKAFPHLDANNAVWLVLTPTRWKALKQTPRKEYATDDAAEVGAPVDKGDTITAVYSVANAEGETWFVSRAGSRMRADAFLPKAG